MKKLGAALVALLVLAGLAVAGVPLIEEHVAAEIKRDIERRGRGSVGAVEVGLFERRLVVRDVQLKGTEDVRIDRIEATGLAWPLRELLQGRMPLSGLRPGDPVQAKRIEIAGLSVAMGSASASVEALSLEGLDLDRYEAGAGDARQDALLMGARVIRALSVRRLDVRGLAVKSAAGDSGASLTTLAVRDAERGLIGALHLAGLDIMAGGTKTAAIRLADMTMGSLDLRRPLSVLAEGDWMVGAPLGRVQVAKASFTGFGGELLARYGVSLAGISQESVRESPTIMRSLGRVEGLVLAPPARGIEALQLRLAMAAMGLNEIRLGLECAGVEDRAKGELGIDRCVLTGTDLGEIDLAVRLVGADEAFWRLVDGEDYSGIENTTAALSSVKLSLTDKSLLERLLKAAAAASGQELPAMRSGLAQEVRRFQPPDVLITEDLTKLLDTVAGFIERGGTLTLEARPDQPLGIDKIGYLRSPGPDIVGVLGLSATLSR